MAAMRCSASVGAARRPGALPRRLIQIL